MTRAYYFGCAGGMSTGHCWWLPGDAPRPLTRSEIEMHTGRPLGCPWGAGEVDANLAPGADVAARSTHRFEQMEQRQVEGPCMLYRKGGWTLIAWWDRSGDKRGNSNSAFAMEGEHDFPEMVAGLHWKFPWVSSRLRFELTLAGSGAA